MNEILKMPFQCHCNHVLHHFHRSGRQQLVGFALPAVAGFRACGGSFLSPLAACAGLHARTVFYVILLYFFILCYITRLTLGCFIASVVPATVVAAASFDDAIAITGYTIFINLAVAPKTGSGWQIAHGPLSLVLGFVAGVVAGVLAAFTKLWNNNFKRTSVLFVLGTNPAPGAAKLRKFFFLVLAS